MGATRRFAAVVLVLSAATAWASAARAATPSSQTPGRPLEAVAVGAAPPAATNSTLNLHIHTYCSDGSDTPEQVVGAAQAAGIRVLAITDHDSTACVERAEAAGKKAGIAIVPGMEISAEDDSIHLLALNIDIRNPGIERLIAGHRRARVDRLQANIAKLVKLQAHEKPIQVTLQEVLVGKINIERRTDGKAPLDPAAAARMSVEELLGMTASPITRPDLARVLVEKGYVKDSREAFDTFLGDSGSANVEMRGTPFPEVIRTIHAAGGIVVLAHPYTIFKYQHFPREYAGRKYLRFDALLNDMLTAGLDGVEQYKNRFGPSGWLVQILNDYASLSGRGIVLTPGSDYHGSSGVGEKQLKAIAVPQAEADKILRALRMPDAPAAASAAAASPAAAVSLPPAAAVQAAVSRAAEALSGL